MSMLSKNIKDTFKDMFNETILDIMGIELEIPFCYE